MSEEELTFASHKKAVRSMMMTRYFELRHAGTEKRQAWDQAATEIGSLLKPPATGAEVSEWLTQAARASGRGGRKKKGAAVKPVETKVASTPMQLYSDEELRMMAESPHAPVPGKLFADSVESPVIASEDVDEKDDPFVPSEEYVLTSALTRELVGLKVGRVRHLTLFDAEMAKKCEAMLPRVAKKLAWATYAVLRRQSQLFVKRTG